MQLAEGRKENCVKKLRFALIGLIILLCSCAAQAPLELGYGKDIVFDCENGYSFTVRFKEGKEAELSLPDKTVTLPRVISGSGARYAEGDMVFWTKGEWALLETGSKSYKNCNVRQ